MPMASIRGYEGTLMEMEESSEVGYMVQKDGFV